MPNPSADQNKKSKNFQEVFRENSVFREWSSVTAELGKIAEGPQGDSLEELAEETKKLFEQIRPHYEKHNDMGSYIPMSEEAYEQLQAQYKKCMDVFDLLPEEMAEEPVCRKLRTMLINDSHALNALSPDSLPPLADVITGSEVPVAELYETNENHTIGADLSSRQAIEYTDKDGTVHRGFFTEEKNVSTLAKDLQSIFARYTKKYPQYKDFFAELGIKGKAFLDSVAELTRYNHEDDYNKFVREVAEVSETKIKDVSGFRKMCRELAEECRPLRNYYDVLQASKIDTGSQIAQRAGAMSDMAAALGEKELLASSRRITVKRGDKVVSGVMMDAAFLDGVDRKKLTDENPFYKIEKKGFDSPELLRSLADLQILDYLCANTDRHKNNFFMRLDNSDPKHPKITGVQGIDNDNAFGYIQDGGVMRLAKGRNLKVITSHMAEKINAMTEKDLERILEPYQFSQMECMAVKERLSNLKEMIANGSHKKADKPAFDKDGHLITKENEIRIIRDEEWKQLSLDSLTPKNEKEENLFVHAKAIRDDQANNKSTIENQKNYEKWVKEKNPERWEREQRENAEQKKATALENQKKTAPLRYTRFDEQALLKNIRTQLEGEREQLRNIDKELYLADGTDKSRSRKFKDMYRKLGEVTEEYNKLCGKIKGFQSLGDKERRTLDADFKELAKKREKLLQSASVYLRKGSIFSNEQLDQRKKSAAQLKEFAQKQPESERFFQSGSTLKDKQNTDLSEKNGYEFSAYMTRQLHDMMKKALYDNVTSLPVGDQKRTLGIRALAAQERLWNFSQKNTPKAVADQGEKEKTDFNRINAENSRVKKDIETILAYAPDVKNMIDRENKKYSKSNGPDRSMKLDSLTPRQVRTVLGLLFEHESQCKMDKSRKIEIGADEENQIRIAEKKNDNRLYRIAPVIDTNLSQEKGMNKGK